MPGWTEDYLRGLAEHSHRVMEAYRAEEQEGERFVQPPVGGGLQIEIGVILRLNSGTPGGFEVRRLDGDANPVGDEIFVNAFLLGPTVGKPGHGNLTNAMPNYKVGDYIRFVRMKVPKGAGQGFIDGYWSLDTLQESCP